MLSAPRDRLRANPAEYAVLLAEPNHLPKASRERAVELLFEKFKVPAVFLAKNAVRLPARCGSARALPGPCVPGPCVRAVRAMLRSVATGHVATGGAVVTRVGAWGVSRLQALSAFATARHTALVVDAGYRGTSGEKRLPAGGWGVGPSLSPSAFPPLHASSWPGIAHVHPHWPVARPQLTPSTAARKSAGGRMAKRKRLVRVAPMYTGPASAGHSQAPLSR